MIAEKVLAYTQALTGFQSKEINEENKKHRKTLVELLLQEVGINVNEIELGEIDFIEDCVVSTSIHYHIKKIPNQSFCVDCWINKDLQIFTIFCLKKQKETDGETRIDVLFLYQYKIEGDDLVLIQ